MACLPFWLGAIDSEWHLDSPQFRDTASSVVLKVRVHLRVDEHGVSSEKLLGSLVNFHRSLCPDASILPRITEHMQRTVVSAFFHQNSYIGLRIKLSFERNESRGSLVSDISQPPVPAADAYWRYRTYTEGWMY